ncbi:YIP1 family protein [Haloarcula litorea]|uniref:YIP1 family protein n=1 Tax=Haloarcula litorea TaxID=3032579 RepID=UPI0023E894B5|nr:YIP1 family protein [Halomicroarcula sp. GDY20]
MPSTARTFLLRPGQFFERRVDALGGVRAAGLAGLVSVLTTLVLAAVLRAFTQQFGGTVTVDNPAYPGEVFCEDGGVAGTTPRGCSEPETVQREISALLWQAVTDLLPWLVIGLVVVWVGLGVALYVGAWLAGGSGSVGATLEVTAWGLVPTLVSSVVAGATLVAFASGADLSGGGSAALLSEVRALQAGVSGLVLLAIQLGGAAWQAYVWTGGLRVVHGLGRGTAAVIAGLVAVVPVLLS